jgi:hypothetical protein
MDKNSIVLRAASAAQTFYANPTDQTSIPFEEALEVYNKDYYLQPYFLDIISTNNKC